MAKSLRCYICIAADNWKTIGLVGRRFTVCENSRTQHISNPSGGFDNVVVNYELFAKNPIGTILKRQSANPAGIWDKGRRGCTPTSIEDFHSHYYDEFIRLTVNPIAHGYDFPVPYLS